MWLAEPPLQHNSDGFTFIEAIIALAVAAIMVAAVTSTLITSLRAEQFAIHAGQADRICERIATAHHAGYSPTDIVEEARESWLITLTEVSSDKKWELWRISPLARPSLGVQFAARRFN
jgi:prepilin-type N-terminal cleavage/methylation domain-containing protein